MRFIFFLFALILLSPLVSAAEVIEKEYRKLARSYGFKLDKHPKFHSNISGVRISIQETEQELERFFKILSVLPHSFVRRSGIERVMICKNLKLNNVPAGGVVSGDCIYLNANFRPKTVYHELFHVFDPKRFNTKWTKLNNKEFRYQGSEFYPENDTRKKRKKKETAKNFRIDFVSNYAQSFEWEDRAETFSYMIVEKEKFVLRTKKSPVLRKKMLYIMEITSKRRLLGRNFWKEILGISDKDMVK